MARCYSVDGVRDSRMKKSTPEHLTCGDCGKPIKGDGILCKQCRDEFKDIIGGVN